MTARSRNTAIALLCLAFTGRALDAQANQPAPATQPSAVVSSDSRDTNVYSDGGRNQRSFVKKLSTNLLLDQRDVWTSPFRMDRSSAKWWLASAGATAALIAADHPIAQALPASGTSVHFGNNFSRAGQWYSVYPFAGALYATGLFAHDDKLRETGALGLQALATSGIAVNILKIAARRERPNAGDGGGHFETGGAAFPSGHSAEAWAIASVVSSEYGNHKWVPVAAYAYASTVSLSRMLAQQHFSSDVLVGGLMGFFVGKFVVHCQRVHQQHLGMSTANRN